MDNPRISSRLCGSKMMCLQTIWLLGTTVSLAQTVPTPVTFTAGMAESFFGRSLAVGDFNGDGIKDLLVGAPGSLGSDPSGINPYTAAGRAFIIHGPTFTDIVELTVPNPLSPEAQGWAVTAGNTGNVHNSAYLSAPFYQGPAPWDNFGVVAYYPNPSAEPGTRTLRPNPLPGTAPISRFGVSLEFAQSSFPPASTLDVGSTGIITASGATAGMAWNVSATALTVNASVLPPCLEPNFGAALVRLPTGAVAFGNPIALRNYASGVCENIPGLGRLHQGAIPGGLNAAWHQSPGASLGTSLATGVPGPGSHLTVAGAPFSNEANVYLLNPSTNNIFGGPGIHPETGLPNNAYGEPLQVLSPAGVGQFGRSLALADMNADGELDLLVGSPGGMSGGSVFVYFGPAPYSDDNRTELTHPGLLPGAGFCVEDFLGWSVKVGDFNGDGKPDIAAGRPCDGLSEEGSVTVFFACADTSECETCSGGFCQAPPAPPAP